MTIYRVSVCEDSVNKCDRILNNVNIIVKVYDSVYISTEGPRIVLTHSEYLPAEGGLSWVDDR